MIELARRMLHVNYGLLKTELASYRATLTNKCSAMLFALFHNRDFVLLNS